MSLYTVVHLSHESKRGVLGTVKEFTISNDAPAESKREPEHEEAKKLVGRV